MLEHGGRLLQAVQRYGVPRERWLDLSTGINPIAWQGAPLPIFSWNRLPEDEDGLIEAAAAYYEAPRLLPTSGSQAAIQTLPRLRERCRVGVPTLGYNEHGHRWKQAGHDVIPVAVKDFGAAVDRLDVLVVCNPNNPTGERVTPVELLEWHARLSARGGWLVVDEAFADSTPETSIARYTDRDGLVVLRSLGKFFGLAGARVGFVLAAKSLLNDLVDWLGPWAIAGPSRLVARAALSDRTWQETTRQRLRQDSRRLAELLTSHGLPPDGGCELFQWVRTPHALKMHDALARQGVLTRHFEAVPSLRFGLPARTEDWHRLETVLGSVQLREVVA
ncbi:MAG: threonine-phosphate decarboxylase [Gammaproteobacteria bacterium]|nr:threonine-phosphate decarboxylase [Gammaproteobacteria bacterium]